MFRDIDDIPLGADFYEKIQQTLRRSQVCLVVIGRDWMEDGRLDSESDFVRMEVEAALAHKLPIFPLLVGGAPMPRPADLPGSMRALTRRNALIVDSGVDFGTHIGRLIAGLEPIVKS